MTDSDYSPLDLSSYYNVTKQVYQGFADPPVGEQQFHGLPFQIGESNHNASCFIGFGPSDGCRNESLTIDVNATAHNIVFAHTVLNSKIMEGSTLAIPVAEYIFTLENGHVHKVLIRERYEIGYLPLPWGQYPFLCVPDEKHVPFDRQGGEWDSAGRRQTETEQGWPKGFYIWAWNNPVSDVPVSSIEINPRDKTLIIGGITLGHVDEDPFCRWAAKDVKIDLKNDDDGNKPFNIDVKVDRGYATYTYPLPEASESDFLNDTHKGWGQSDNEKSSPAYTSIAGTPSATVTVNQDGKAIATAKWGELENKGVVETPKVRLEVVDTGRNWVHTQVLDADSGEQIPCRVHFRSDKGIPYAPHGHHAHVNSDLGTWHIDVGGDVRLGQMSYAYIDGKCQGWLPRGDVYVDIARGYEYEPLRAKINIKPGQRELTLKLKRWVNLNEERYFSGDTHVHFLSTQGAHMEAQGEGLNVVNLLLSQWGNLFTNTEEFTGAPNVAPHGDTIVYATQENRQHILGHLSLLGLKEPVMPWCSDGPSEAELGGNLETTLSYWADECHKQGGTVVIPHIPNPNCEPAVLIATDRADSVEMLVHDEYNHLEYYRYLNCGYKLPLSGGTDKMSSDVPVGIYRTYVYIPPDEPFTYDNWCKALRNGNTFLSAGPIIRFTVDGKPIGDTVELSGNGGTVEVEASAESTLPIHSLEIVKQGKVVASTEESDGTRRLSLKTSIKIDGHTWLAARCAGPNYSSIAHHDGWRRGIMAHTSPIYVACGGPYHLFDLENAHYMLSLIEGGLSYIRKRSYQHKPGTTTHHHGLDDHYAFLEHPYKEAMEAIHKRMHKLGIPH